MKYSPTLLAFAALLAIVYGVLFSFSYPLVEISGGIVALCVLLGIVTCLVIATIWSALTGSRTPPADTTPPARPARTNPRARRSNRRKPNGDADHAR
jgi:hypothetical protein